MTKLSGLCVTAKTKEDMERIFLSPEYLSADPFERLFALLLLINDTAKQLSYLEAWLKELEK